MTVETYKGYGIDFNIYGEHEYSVQVCGDDFLFPTLDEARDFIDDTARDMSTSVETYKNYEIVLSALDEHKYSIVNLNDCNSWLYLDTHKQAIDFIDEITE